MSLIIYKSLVLRVLTDMSYSWFSYLTVNFSLLQTRFCCSLPHICEQLWVLHSSQHLRSELQIHHLVCHFAVHYPVHTKVLDEHFADHPEHPLVTRQTP